MPISIAFAFVAKALLPVLLTIPARGYLRAARTIVDY